MKDVVHELAKLELIDSISKLGLSKLFLDEIQKALDVVAAKPLKNKQSDLEDCLYRVALRFRLLRQHGYDVSQASSWMKRVHFPKSNAQMSKDCLSFLRLLI